MTELKRNEDGTLDRYAFPGGYELHYITEDAGCLCHNCANRENGSIAYVGVSPDGIEDAQWHIVASDTHWEGEPLTCDHCNREIASEYGNPDDDKPAPVKDFSDYAEMIEYRNERESGFGGNEGEWFYGDDDSLTIYTGTFGNDHSPGASAYTSHDTYETREDYDRALAELEAMPESIDDDESDDESDENDD